jgi:hypothetical protein
MIEAAIIFSKEIKDVVLTSSYGKLDPTSAEFASSLEKINEIALNQDKGLFDLDLGSNLIALVYTSNRLAVTLIFKQKLDKKMITEWENVAKEITTGFNRVYDPWKVEDESYKDYKETMDKIIDWQLKESSPIDKMKDALW